MNSFCTIITYSHIAWALTLYDSLLKHNQDVNFIILIVDKKKSEIDVKYLDESYDIIFMEDLILDQKDSEIVDKYKNDLDRLRWCLKPVFMKHCLVDYETVIYCDCDIYFVNNYDFLINDIQNNAIILTPHWRSSVANVDTLNFDLLFIHGLYNAGFIGASRAGVPALNHWAQNCYCVCYRNAMKGFFDDQAHLNLLPIYFENIKIIKHRGCNIANWNQVECKRTNDLKTNKITINNEYEIIFIHFTKNTIAGIVEGRDKCLQPYFDKFAKNLNKNEDFE